MKKIIIVILSVLVLANVSIAQKYTPHVKGDSAMLFSFSGLGFLAAFEYQGGFGYKKFLNDKTAVRGAFSLSNAKETISWGPESYPDGYVGEDGSDKEFGIGLELAGEMHRNKGKVDPYYGAGVGFSMIRTKYIEPVRGPQGTALTASEIKNNLDDNAMTSFSVFGILGVEYAINAAITLAAEYHLGFNFASEPDMKVIDPSGVETSFSGGKYSYFGISSVGLLTLAIYLN
jgi:opacity protein-like surface antigen